LLTRCAVAFEVVLAEVLDRISRDQEDVAGVCKRMAFAVDLRIADRLSYDPDSNTVFMNYSGMRVRTQTDLDRIKVTVDELLGPLRKKVYSIVNYDRFEADADVMHTTSPSRATRTAGSCD
jgi:hypothetical protein